MRKTLVIVCVICGISSILYGCARWEKDEAPDVPNPPTSQTNNEEEKYKAALEELIKGPESEKLISNITKNTEVISVNKNDIDVITDFNEAFNRFKRTA
jgi:spore germination protein GerM